MKLVKEAVERKVLGKAEAETLLPEEALADWKVRFGGLGQVRWG